MMKRRRFLGVIAGAVAAVVPVASWLFNRPSAPPEIGAEFYVAEWVGYLWFDTTEHEYREINSGEEALSVAAENERRAFGRLEKARGVRLGGCKREVNWHHDQIAWYVVSMRAVVGYV